jgi:Predicted Fe-S-cluster oxidoreductase
MQVKRCNSCPGLCCVVAGEIKLTYEEAKRVATQFNKNISDIANVFVKDGKTLLLLKKGPGLVCPFLGSDNRCTIYEIRPKTCKEYTCKNDPILYQLWRQLRPNAKIKNINVSDEVIRLLTKNSGEKP